MKRFSHNPMKRHCQINVKRIDHKSRFRIECRSAAGDNPIGPRLERGKPLPVTQTEFSTEEEAKEAADKLQGYIDEYEARRRPGKRRRRR